MTCIEKGVYTSILRVFFKYELQLEKQYREYKIVARIGAASPPTGTAFRCSIFRNSVGTFATKSIKDCQMKRCSYWVVQLFSEKHTNFIINDNNATVNDIKT